MKPRVVQRGASNIYFSVVESALDIPPWSDDIQKKIGTRWSLLENALTKEDRKVLIRALRLAEITRKSETEIEAIIEDRIARLKSPDRNIRWEEYQQFVAHVEPFGENTEFEIRPSTPPPELDGWLESIIRATRLREVRAVRGFTRLFPPTLGDEARVAKIALGKPSWLPAVENRGEGIFVQLGKNRLSQWENSEPVVKRVASIRAAYEREWQKRDRPGGTPKAVTPRFLLVHSLAHCLIRQLSLTCGYSSASLRERLYVDTGDWEMAGLLVFTSSPDADGTLGGLARQADAANIVRIFEDALSSMLWCSSDPLCIDGIHAISDPSSGAACHACLLASETSCEEFNSFLDRALLVGTPKDATVGFFTPYIRGLKD